MRRVKGGMEMPINSTIMMAGIIGIFMLIVLVYISLGTNAKIVQANINSLNSIDSTQIVEDCFKNENGLITRDFLNDNDDKNICEICGICETMVEVTVEDLEDKREWKFKYTDAGDRLSKIGQWFADNVKFWNNQDHATNSMLINIAIIKQDTVKEIHAGRIHVKV